MYFNYFQLLMSSPHYSASISSNPCWQAERQPQEEEECKTLCREKPAHTTFLLIQVVHFSDCQKFSRGLVQGELYEILKTESPKLVQCVSKLPGVYLTKVDQRTYKLLYFFFFLCQFNSHPLILESRTSRYFTTETRKQSLNSSRTTKVCILIRLTIEFNFTHTRII